MNHKSVQTIGPANKKIKKQALALEKTRLEANKERKAKIKGTAKMLNRFKNKCKYSAFLCSFYMCTVKWAATRETLSSGVCEQQRRRPACASAQSDQRLCYSLIGKVIFKLASSEISIF